MELMLGELYDWAQMRKHEGLTNILFCHVTSEKYDTIINDLNKQYTKAKTIQEIQKYH